MKGSLRREVLVKALVDRNEAVRRSAAEALEQFEAKLALPGLIESWQQGDKVTRISIVYALTRIYDDRADALLLQSLEDPTEDVRAAALRALQDRPGVDYAGPLMKRLGDDSKVIRCLAIETLGSLRCRRATEHLLPLLGHPDLEVVQRTVVALGRMRDNRAEIPLLTLADVEDGYTRSLVITALGELDL